MEGVAVEDVEEAEGVVDGLEPDESAGPGGGAGCGEDGLGEGEVAVAVLEPSSLGVEEASEGALSVGDEEGSGGVAVGVDAVDGEGDVEVVVVEEAKEGVVVSLLEESESVVDEGGGPGSAAGRGASAGEVSGEEDAVGSVGIGDGASVVPVDAGESSSRVVGEGEGASEEGGDALGLAVVVSGALSGLGAGDEAEVCGGLEVASGEGLAGGRGGGGGVPGAEAASGLAVGNRASRRRVARPPARVCALELSERPDQRTEERPSRQDAGERHRP